LNDLFFGIAEFDEDINLISCLKAKVLIGQSDSDLRVWKACMPKHC